MTILKAINVFLLQWLFIRLTKCTENRVELYNLYSFDLMSDGNIASNGNGVIKTYQWYSIQYWILPCSGWWNSFILLNKPTKYIKCTKEKYIN